MNSRFGGILQIRNQQPICFTEIINYGGSSLDPFGIFIKANMTSVKEVALTGDGMILANFRLGGLNPVAAAQEAGIEAENRSMSTFIEYGDLIDYRDI